MVAGRRGRRVPDVSIPALRNRKRQEQFNDQDDGADSAGLRVRTRDKPKGRFGVRITYGRPCLDGTILSWNRWYDTERARQHAIESISRKRGGYMAEPIT